MSEAISITEVQREFLFSVVKAIVRKGSSVSTVEIQESHGRSESCVRNHIGRLDEYGLIICVGKVDHHKMFTLSQQGINIIFDLLMDAAQDDPVYGELLDGDKFGIGGHCQSNGCQKMAEDYYRNGFYCRDCIIGCTLDDDLCILRDEHESTWDIQGIRGDDEEFSLVDFQRMRHLSYDN